MGMERSSHILQISHNARQQIWQNQPHQTRTVQKGEGMARGRLRHRRICKDEEGQVRRGSQSSIRHPLASNLYIYSPTSQPSYTLSSHTPSTPHAPSVPPGRPSISSRNASTSWYAARSERGRRRYRTPIELRVGALPGDGPMDLVPELRHGGEVVGAEEGGDGGEAAPRASDGERSAAVWRTAPPERVAGDDAE
jgi:hypothetical protein